MPIRDILLLGDERLYRKSAPVSPDEVPALAPVIEDLHDTMEHFKSRHGWGRAIAAPQIGVHKRIVAMHVDAPLTLINPVIDEPSEDMMEHWEDCMSFPELLVRLRNPRQCRLTYRDADWTEHRFVLTGDFAELLQHEVDHLDGVLSVMRAVDERSIVLRRARPPKDPTLRGAFEPAT